ncbi:MAG: hypothetical protein QOK37_1432 [Thermoanaerobaculia bacterium]|jgi:hypothetical protein|nr:hypothetical protein [Thermoanaerobaculia bacterium]
MPSQSITNFADIARTFVTWAESTGSAAPESEVKIARALLAKLIVGVTELAPGSVSTDPPEISQDEYARIFRRFGSLPFNHYSECFNPLIVPPEEPVVAASQTTSLTSGATSKPGWSCTTVVSSKTQLGNGQITIHFTGATTQRQRSTPFKHGSLPGATTQS